MMDDYVALAISNTISAVILLFLLTQIGLIGAIILATVIDTMAIRWWHK